MELLDTAIANVALPHIAGGLALAMTRAPGPDKLSGIECRRASAFCVAEPRLRAETLLHALRRALHAEFLALCLAPSLALLIFFRVLQASEAVASLQWSRPFSWTRSSAKATRAFALYSMAIVTAL